MKPHRMWALTAEDINIWGLRGWPCVHWTARDRMVRFYRESDRRDAELMYLRERAKASTTEAWEDWATHRREWFPSYWGWLA